MTNLKSRARHLYQRVTSSIGFYPTLIAIAFLALYFLVAYIEFTSIGKAIKEALSNIVLDSDETARTILASIIGGIISLTVFSFSMVMVVLSQTSATFSPKVLRGLISYKSHQFVLGIYIGTLIFSILLLLEIRKDEEVFQIPSIGIYMAIVFAVASVALFVYFVHSISESIQIGNIIRHIHEVTRKETLSRQKEYNKNYFRNLSIKEDDYTWYAYPARAHDNYQNFNVDKLLNVARKHNIIIKVECYRGEFLLGHLPLFSITKNFTSTDKALDEIYNTFSFYEGELVHTNPHYGYSQLMEVAIKALSPGINDPGSAILCINRLTDLLCLRMECEDEVNYYDQDGELRIIDKPHNFDKLLFTAFPPIRHYGKEDRDIVVAILQSIYKLSLKDKERKFATSLQSEADASVEAADKYLQNKQSQAYINHIINNMNKSGYFDLPLLLNRNG